MFGRGVFRLIAAIALIALLGAAGASIYQAGLTQGLAQTGTAVAPAVVPYYYGWHPFGFGGGLFGFFGGLLFLFLIIGLLRAIFFGGRRGWGGPGRGGWSGHDHDPSGMRGFRGSPWESRAREVHDEWHRTHEAGGSSSPGGSSAGGTTPAGGPSSTAS